MDPERQREVQGVVMKAAAVVVGIALVVGLGTWLVVRTLDLDESGTQTVGGVANGPVAPLPSTALPVPSESAPTPSEGESEYTPPPEATSTGLYLSATPVTVSPMEKVYLTGHWAGHDAVGLQVQRFESGGWTDFGVQANVSVGTFETFVMTGREGENRFRVRDPGSGMASNEVRITVQ